MDLVELIVKCAEIPSFSSYEDRFHDFIFNLFCDDKEVVINKVKDNNLILKIPGNKDKKTVAITAHLDKINHFGEAYPERLFVEVKDGKIIGQMDDAVGVAIALHLALNRKPNYPPLLILSSEMEESFGLKKHPHLLKNEGKHLGPQIGAKRIAAYLDKYNMAPAAFITIDTTPIFKGEPGTGIYTDYWEKKGGKPKDKLISKIKDIRQFLLHEYPDLIVANGNNDYLEYAAYFASKNKGYIPSIALEPAIFPHHQQKESVFIENVIRIEEMIDYFLLNYSVS